jgi:eukaryotic sulfide quinone oxidoreductase
VKCPGAAQKIMWLFEGQDRRNFIRDKVSIEYWIPAQAMFGIPKYSEILTKLADQRNIIRQFNKQLVSVNENKTAVFYDSMTKLNQTVPFDVLHIVPPMCPPDCLLGSPLSNVDGYVAVDQYTLQSERYPNIFALGDCTSLPTSKTAAAAISQAPVLVHNLKKEITGQTLNGRYDGYTSCPLVLSKNEVLLAEFGYDKKIMETFSPATGRFPCSLIGQEGDMHRRFFFWMNQNMFPFVYWNLWTRGRWFGRNGLCKPDVTKK